MNRLLIAVLFLLMTLPVFAQQRPDRPAPGQRARRGAMAERFTDYPNHPPKVGTEAPDFVLATPDGNEVRLSAFRGKSYVVLEHGAYT